MMTNEQAKEILEQALNAAMLKGVYTLSDAQKILEALSILFNQQSNE